MDKKYLKYSVEELVNDAHFMAWILRSEGAKDWKSFMRKHPEFEQKCREAKEVLALLEDKKDNIADSETIKIWQNIREFELAHTKKSRRFMVPLKWAASILLIAAMGISGYLVLSNLNSGYEFTAQNVSHSDDARLILSDGEEIALQEEKPSISVSNKNELVINNKKKIDLTQKIEEKKREVQLQEVVIPYGRRSELLLADGTKVWLNAGSRFAFPVNFEGKRREVYLEGEACFKVVSNAEKPFIVNTDKLEVKVLGTHFNVSAYAADPEIETVLLEGSVALHQKSLLKVAEKEMLLKPMQKAVFSREEKEIEISEEPRAATYLSWTDGWFQFSRQSLGRVLTKLERYYDVEFDVEKDVETSRKLSGKLDLKDSVEDVMKVICDVAKLDYEIKENKVYIFPKNEKMKER